MIWDESVLRTVGRWGLSLLTLGILIALSIVPFQVAHLGDIRPSFVLIAVYYWSVLRASPLIALLAFAVGLLIDLVSGYPIGMHAIAFVAAQWVTSAQRRFLMGQSFPVLWAGFALVALGVGLLQWGLFSLFNWTLVAPKLILISTALTVFLFPAMVVPLSIVHKALADDPSSMQ